MMPGARGLLEWQRAALDGGQWLRLMSAHLAHLDSAHLLFNLLGLLLIAELLMERWRAAFLLSLVVTSAMGTSVFLWCFEPQLQWYTGLSVLLHGLWAGAALTGCLRRDGLLPAGALAALAVKLAWLHPALSLMALTPAIALPPGMLAMQALSGVPAQPVVTVAHLYGAFSGFAWAGASHAWWRLRHLD